MGSTFKQIILIIFATSLVSACSLDASLTDLSQVASPVLEKMRTEADFVSGEIVTTGSGVVIKGTFGEVSEKKVLGNGIQIEGAFYE